MPFHIAISSSGKPVIAPSMSGRPPSAPTLPSPDAGGPHRLGLDRLPAVVMRQLVAWLTDAATVSIARTSKRMHTVLDGEFVRPIRLAEQVQWIGSHTTFQCMAQQIWQCPAEQRAPLWKRLHEQVEELHPALRERARLTLAGFGITARAQPPLGLDDVLRSPAPDLGRRLASWMSAPRTDHGERTAMRWLEMIDTLPMDARVPALAALVRNLPDADTAQWLEVVDAALKAALQGGHTAAHTAGQRTNLRRDVLTDAQRAQLLLAVADALARRPAGSDSVPHRTAIAEMLLRTAGGLPAGLQAPLLVALCRLAHQGVMGTAARTSRDARTLHAALIDAVCASLRPADAAVALVAMLAPLREYEDTACFMPLVNAVLTAAATLPDECAVPVMCEVLVAAPYGRQDDGAFEAMWDALFAASRDIDPMLQLPLLVRLARMIDGTSAEPQARWSAFQDRLHALPPALRREPLLALTDHPDGLDVPAAFVVPRLLAMGAELESRDFARLLSGMLRDFQHEPAWRRVLVNAAANLTTRDRFGPLSTLADDLITWPRGSRTHTIDPDQAAAVAPMPSDASFATWPRSAEEARRQLVDILAMLPLSRRGELLLRLASPHNGATTNAWILSEMRRLPPTGRHDVMLYSDLAGYAATQCRAEEAHLLLPALADAIASLEPAQSPTAIYWLAEACKRVGMLELLRGPIRGALVERMPVADRLPTRSDLGHKRKAGMRPRG